MPNSAPKLSIIIINFETPNYTLQCIRSIRENPPRCSYEIILIDNGSKDGSLDVIRENAPEVICIETGSNLGFSRANNLGISNARGAYIMLLNSDTKILDNSLARLVEYLDAWPEVGAVGPRQLDAEGRLQLSWGGFPTFVSELYRKVVHYRLSVNDLNIRDYIEEKFSGRHPVDWISGSCLLARREALISAGLLDPHYFMYFEDLDLCRRIRDEGWKIHYNSEMTILHYGGVSAKKNILRVLVEYRRSQMYFTRKYYGLGGVLLLKVLLFFKSSVNFVRWLAIFGLNAALRRHRAMRENFAKVLLSKKTIELVFGWEPVQPTD